MKEQRELGAVLILTGTSLVALAAVATHLGGTDWVSLIAGTLIIAAGAFVMTR